jgi:hypothetical protein
MKPKTKSIQIDSEIHSQLKKYCDIKGLKLQKLIEKLILKGIKDDRSV